jgi:hypothetical protein
MELRAYEVGDEDRIPEQPGGEGMWTRNVMAGLAMMGSSATAVADGRVVIVIGTIKLWPGVADGWCLVHPDSGLSARALIRIIKATLEDWARMEEVWRVNAMAMTEKQMRFLRLLGFEHEYTQRRAGPEGIDLYGMVKWIKGLH